MNQLKRAFHKISGKRLFVSLLLAVTAVLLDSTVFASPTGVSVSAIATNVGKTVSELATVLADVSIIAGIGFVMASFFKFHQHKLNPTQVPMSQGITLLLIGAALLLFPTMLPTATKAVFGTASFGTVSGSGIKGLIGAS